MHVAMTKKRRSNRPSILDKFKEITRLRSLGSGTENHRDMMSDWYSDIIGKAQEMKRFNYSKESIERHLMSSFARFKSHCVLFDVIPENASLKIMQAIEIGMNKKKEYIEYLISCNTDSDYEKTPQNVVWAIIEGYNLKGLTEHLNNFTLTELGKLARNKKAREERKANKKTAKTTTERVYKYRAANKPLTSKKEQTIQDVQKYKASDLTQLLTAEKLGISIRTVKSYWTI